MVCFLLLVDLSEVLFLQTSYSNGGHCSTAAAEKRSGAAWWLLQIFRLLQLNKEYDPLSN
jgi:hypothetical protein